MRGLLIHGATCIKGPPVLQRPQHIQSSSTLSELGSFAWRGAALLIVGALAVALLRDCLCTDSANLYVHGRADLPPSSEALIRVA